MAGKVIVSTFKKYILVRITGDPLSPEYIMSTLSEIVKKAIAENLDIVIHREITVTHQSTIIDFYYYAHQLVEYSFRNKLALVFPEEMYYNNLDFFKTTAKNQGINVQLFPTLTEAIHWIDNESGKRKA